MVIQKMYDIVFIGYKEEEKEKNWQTLVSKFPTAKRVDGVRGLHQAHRVGAKMCWPKMFWIVDGDAIVLDESIKALGIYHISIKLDSDLKTEIKIYVIKT